jgi:hypothetical protein
MGRLILPYSDPEDFNALHVGELNRPYTSVTVYQSTWHHVPEGNATPI